MIEENRASFHFAIFRTSSSREVHAALLDGEREHDAGRAVARLADAPALQDPVGEVPRRPVDPSDDRDAHVEGPAAGVHRACLHRLQSAPDPPLLRPGEVPVRVAEMRST